MVVNNNVLKYTPTEQRMLKVLSDGGRHDKEELLEQLADNLSTMKAVYTALCILRSKLRPLGEDIVCVYRYKKFYYQHIRLLTPACRE